MIGLSLLVTAHILRHRKVIADMYHIVIRQGGRISVSKSEHDIQRVTLVFDKIDLYGVDRIKRLIIAAFCARLVVNPRPVNRKYEHVIIQQQQPSYLFNKLTCAHKRVRIIQHILHGAFYRHGVAVLISYVHRVQLFHFVHYAF